MVWRNEERVEAVLRVDEWVKILKQLEFFSRHYDARWLLLDGDRVTVLPLEEVVCLFYKSG